MAALGQPAVRPCAQLQRQRLRLGARDVHQHFGFFVGLGLRQVRESDRGGLANEPHIAAGKRGAELAGDAMLGEGDGARRRQARDHARDGMEMFGVIAPETRIAVAPPPVLPKLP
jgi:hypothetical protein